jgi:hypothetical protein
MFCPFFFMASMAGDGFGLDSCPFRLHVGFDVYNIPVTTVAGIGSMNRLGKLPFADFTRMATEALRVVNTLRAIFATPDDEFLPLFSWFRRRG